MIMSLCVDPGFLRLCGSRVDMYLTEGNNYWRSTWYFHMTLLLYILLLVAGCAPSPLRHQNPPYSGGLDPQFRREAPCLRLVPQKVAQVVVIFPGGCERL